MENNYLGNHLADKGSNAISSPMLSKMKAPIQNGGSIFTQSATSFTRAVIKWSFPRAERFKDKILPTKDVPLLDLGTTLGKTATSLGFGKRYEFRPLDTPGPSLSHRSLPSLKTKNQSMSSVGFSNRESWDTHKEIPGPGSYELERGFLKANKGVCLKSRTNVLNPVKEFPAPNYYSPKANITEKSRFADIRFGTSKRHDFTKTGHEKNPGPGTYEIISDFEKKTRDFKIKEAQINFKIKLDAKL